MREYTPEEAEALAARLRRKADRRDEWAEARTAHAEEAYRKAQDATAGIPFGQPILVDHYSARRHRAALDRSARNMDKLVEHSAAAREHERKADVMRAVADEALRRSHGPRYSKDLVRPGDRIMSRSRTGPLEVSCVVTRANAKSVTAWAVHAGHPVDTPTDQLRPIWPQLKGNGPRPLPYLKVRWVWRQQDDGTWAEVEGLHDVT